MALFLTVGATSSHLLTINEINDLGPAQLSPGKDHIHSFDINDAAISRQ